MGVARFLAAASYLGHPGPQWLRAVTGRPTWLFQVPITLILVLIRLSTSGVGGWGGWQGATCDVGVLSDHAGRVGEGHMDSDGES
jgi:hypothetical protein